MKQNDKKNQEKKKDKKFEKDKQYKKTTKRKFSFKILQIGGSELPKLQNKDEFKFPDP